jgi:hypothetical protein
LISLFFSDAARWSPRVTGASKIFATCFYTRFGCT